MYVGVGTVVFVDVGEGPVVLVATGVCVEVGADVFVGSGVGVRVGVFVCVGVLEGVDVGVFVGCLNDSGGACLPCGQSLVSASA